LKTKDFKTVDEVVEYVNYAKKNRMVAPSFVGFEPYRLLLLSGMVAPLYSSIRIMYSGLPDIHYRINETGYLEEIGPEDPQPEDPRLILSNKEQPVRWEPGLLRRAGSHEPIIIP